MSCVAGIEPAVGEIATRLGAAARGQRRLEELGRELHDVVERLAALLARFVLGETFGSGMPACAASRSTASGNEAPR